ncbi:MAG: hypothetical protein HYX51_02680 [Chloroflexi bacterium]|nr:hypothetical protein [Chloroflexota bacterium]
MRKPDRGGPCRSTAMFTLLRHGLTRIAACLTVSPRGRRAGAVPAAVLLASTGILALLSPMARAQPPAPYVDPDTGLRFAALIGDTRVPVYAPTGNPLGMRLLSLQYEGVPPGAVSLTLGDLQDDGSHALLSVISAPPGPDGDEQATPLPPELIDLGYNPYHDIYVSLQANGRGISRAYPAGLPEVLVREITVAGLDFNAEFICWQAAGPFCVYTLLRPDRAIGGASAGLETATLATVLESMTILQEDPDTLARYEAEQQRRAAEGREPARRGPRPADDPALRDRQRIDPQSLLLRAYGAEDTDAPRVLSVQNRSDHFALVINESWQFDGRFILTVPSGLTPVVVSASGVSCVPVDGRPNALLCAADGAAAALEFSARPAA